LPYNQSINYFNNAYQYQPQYNQAPMAGYAPNSYTNAQSNLIRPNYNGYNGAESFGNQYTQQSYSMARNAIYTPPTTSTPITATNSASSGYSLYQNILNNGGQQQANSDASGYTNDLFSTHFGNQEQAPAAAAANSATSDYFNYYANGFNNLAAAAAVAASYTNNAANANY
jgi:hypothetical protein